jgi:hypothetical protein
MVPLPAGYKGVSQICKSYDNAEYTRRIKIFNYLRQPGVGGL